MADLIDFSRPFLLDKANALKNSANTVRTLTEEIKSEIVKMRSTWKGEAAEKYVTKFNGLHDDFEERYKVINQYAQFLISAADAMDAVENKTVSQEDSLS